MAGIYEDYVPGPVPYSAQDLPRYLEDELGKLSRQLARKVASQILALEDTTTGFVIDFPPGTWNQLFVGKAPTIDAPASWDIPTGVWTAPYSGLYRASLGLVFTNISAAAQGTMHFYAGIEVGVSGNPQRFGETEAPVGTSSASVRTERALLLSAGDQVTFWAEAVNEGTQTQTCNVAADAWLSRVD